MKRDKQQKRIQPQSNGQAPFRDKTPLEGTVQKIKRHPLILAIALIGSLTTWVTGQTDALSKLAELTGFSTKQEKAHDLAKQILGQTFRRATSRNFSLRGMDREEFSQVLISISAAHTAVQSRFVEFKSIGDPIAAGMLESMLSSLDTLQTHLIKMKNTLPVNLTSHSLLASGATREGAIFQSNMIIAEQLRLEYVSHQNAFASKMNIVLTSSPSK